MFVVISGHAPKSSLVAGLQNLDDVRLEGWTRVQFGGRLFGLIAQDRSRPFLCVLCKWKFPSDLQAYILVVNDGQQGVHYRL